MALVKLFTNRSFIWAFFHLFWVFLCFLSFVVLILWLLFVCLFVLFKNNFIKKYFIFWNICPGKTKSQSGIFLCISRKNMDVESWFWHKMMRFHAFPLGSSPYKYPYFFQRGLNNPKDFFLPFCNTFSGKQISFKTGTISEEILSFKLFTHTRIFRFLQMRIFKFYVDLSFCILLLENWQN